MATSSEPITDHLVLFRSSRGPQMRRLAGFGIVVALLMMAALGRLLTHHVTVAEDLAGRHWWLAGGALGAATLFGVAASRLARRFVVHLEIWPRSHLAVIKTAGIRRERINMVAWHELSTGQVMSVRGPADLETGLRIRLRSGRMLMLDLHGSDTPHGITAVHRLLDKCSLPAGLVFESGPPPLGSVTA